MRLLRRLGRGGGGGVGQQLGDRHGVEVGELGELLHGDGAVAALVGAHDDGLPPALRLLLDAVQGQALLLADGAQPRAECARVVAGHGTSCAVPSLTVTAGRGRAASPCRPSVGHDVTERDPPFAPRGDRPFGGHDCARRWSCVTVPVPDTAGSQSVRVAWHRQLR